MSKTLREGRPVKMCLVPQDHLTSLLWEYWFLLLQIMSKISQLFIVRNLIKCRMLGTCYEPYWLRTLGEVIARFRHLVWNMIRIESPILRDITPCSPLKVNRRFGGTCGLYLQGRWISQARNQRESKWQNPVYRVFRWTAVADLHLFNWNSF
jgi:hypothetical protein